MFKMFSSIQHLLCVHYNVSYGYICHVCVKSLRSLHGQAHRQNEKAAHVVKKLMNMLLRTAVLDDCGEIT